MRLRIFVTAAALCIAGPALAQTPSTKLPQAPTAHYHAAKPAPPAMEPRGSSVPAAAAPAGEPRVVPGPGSVPSSAAPASPADSSSGSMPAASCAEPGASSSRRARAVKDQRVLSRGSSRPMSTGRSTRSTSQITSATLSRSRPVSRKAPGLSRASALTRTKPKAVVSGSPQAASPSDAKRRGVERGG